MNIAFQPNSTLSAGLILSLAAFYLGKWEANPDLSQSAVFFLLIFGTVWLMFVFSAMARSRR